MYTEWLWSNWYAFFVIVILGKEGGVEFKSQVQKREWGAEGSRGVLQCAAEQSREKHLVACRLGEHQDGQQDADQHPQYDAAAPSQGHQKSVCTTARPRLHCAPIVGIWRGGRGRYLGATRSIALALP